MVHETGESFKCMSTGREDAALKCARQQRTHDWKILRFYIHFPRHSSEQAVLHPSE